MRGADELRGGRPELLPTMRGLREGAGLSYARLAARTHYSRSSWERFLNGKYPLNSGAVRQFAEAVGAEPQRLLALYAEAGGGREDSGGAGSAGAGSGAAGSGGADTGRTDHPAVGGSSGPAPAVLREPGRARRRVLPGVCLLIGLLVGGLLPASLLVGGLAPAGQPQAHAPGPRLTTGGVPGAPAAAECHRDARNVARTAVRGLRVEVLYSPACGAVWGLVTHGGAGDRVTVEDERGRRVGARVRSGADVHTPMLAAPEGGDARVRVCGVLAGGAGTACETGTPGRAGDL